MGNDSIKIPILRSNKVEHLDLMEILSGIVPAEMPSNWPDEALVCQAVVARTFILRSFGWGWRHGVQAPLCDNPACCLAYDPAKASAAATEAITRSRGLVVTYNGAIAPVFWSAYCGGHTRSNYDIGWVKDQAYELPHLRGHNCGCVRYHDEVEKKLNSVGRFGHGVGLCQYGARDLAEQGYHWRKILKHYFDGIEIVDWHIPWEARGGQAEA